MVLLKIILVLVLGLVGLLAYHTSRNTLPESGPIKVIFEVMRAASIIWIALGLTFLVAYCHHYPL